MAASEEGLREIGSPRTIGRLLRSAVPVAAPLLAFAVAIVGSIITGTNPSSVTEEVTGASSSAGGYLEDVSTWFPLGFAFSAGMISAVNPCGFTMLPAYFGLYLGTGSPQARARSPIRQFGQALLVGLTVTAGFMLLFAVVGISIGAGAQFVVDAFPWIGLAVGVLLLAAGGWLLAGGTLYNAIGDRLAARIGDPSQASVKGYFLFGLSYGTASLSCTLPIFITVIGGSIALADVLPSVGQFVLYGLGMGAVILALTLSMALFKAALVEKLRRAMVFFQPLSAALMLAAGAFIIYYLLTFGELLDSFT